MNKINGEILYSEYVLRKHQAQQIVPKTLNLGSVRGWFVKSLIRHTYLFPDQDSESYLTKKYVIQKIKDFEQLPKNIRKDILNIARATLFKAYSNDDRIRMIDYLVREARIKEFNPKTPLIANLDESLKGLHQINKSMKILKQKYKEQDISRSNRIFPKLKIKDIQKNIKRAIRSNLEAVRFLAQFSIHFPDILNRSELELFTDHMITINNEIKSIEENRDQIESQDFINAFYYLLKCYVQKTEDLDSESAKGRIIEISSLLGMKLVSDDTLPRKLARGRNFINRAPNSKKLQSLEKDFNC